MRSDRYSGSVSSLITDRLGLSEIIKFKRKPPDDQINEASLENKNIT
jgi:hypothetical protein